MRLSPRGMIASGQCFQALKGESLMKRRYQIGAGRAVQRVRQWAEEENPAVHLMLPMIEILALARQGEGELVREAGLRVILLAIQQEADALTGARHQHGPDRQALRWSREDGFVVVDGQKSTHRAPPAEQ